MFRIFITLGSVGENVISFGVDLFSSVHIDNKRNDILIVGIGSTQGLDDTTLTIEAPYSINFSRSNKTFCLTLHYSRNNSLLFVNAPKIYQFKTKDSEMKNILCV